MTKAQVEQRPAPPLAVLVTNPGGQATLRLSGRWRLDQPLPEPAALLAELATLPDELALNFDCTELGDWDSGLVAYLVALRNGARQVDGEAVLHLDQSGLPKGVQGLLHLAFAVPEASGARRAEANESFLHEMGADALGLARSTGEIMAFLGEAVLSLRRCGPAPTPCRCVRRSATHPAA